MDKVIELCKSKNGAPRGREASVHVTNNIRFNKAKEQKNLEKVEIEEIIEYVQDFLKSEAINMKDVKFLYIEMNGKTMRQVYKEIRENSNLQDKRDIVWMKFTETGYLGVVACSNDINFSYPNSEDDYDEKVGKKYRYNSSGIIISHIGERWDKSFVLVFPLENIPEGMNRSDIECGIGNYLIDKGVPILDFYSHNY